MFMHLMCSTKSDRMDPSFDNINCKLRGERKKKETCSSKKREKIEVQMVKKMQAESRGDLKYTAATVAAQKR